MKTMCVMFGATSVPCTLQAYMYFTLRYMMEVVSLWWGMMLRFAAVLGIVL